MKYNGMETAKAIIERSSTGRYSIYMDAENEPRMWFVSGEGATEREAKEEFMTNYNVMKDHYKKEGEKFEDVEFVFEYDFNSFFEYYKKYMTLKGISEITGIAEGLLSHYSTGLKKPKETTQKKFFPT